MTMEPNIAGGATGGVSFSPAVGLTRDAVGGSVKSAPDAAPRRRRGRGKLNQQNGAPTTGELSVHNGAALSTAPLSDFYREFLGQLQRDRTLPPELVNTNAPDITHMTLEQLSNSEDVYNRELSWLDFNWRVLHEAVDGRTPPLLERLKFIAITSSNLDEYFSKRVGGLKRQRAAGMANLTLDGWAPEVQLR
jgi:hypothetical protein